MGNRVRFNLSETPSFHGRYDRVLVNCGLSKACGLPGLRIGWVFSTPEKAEQLWGYKDYTTIGPSALSDRLARAALEPATRRRILRRTRGIVRAQLPILARWVAGHGELLEMIPPRAGAIACLAYALRIGSTRLYERLRDEKSVLIVPGDFYGMDRYVRIGFGAEPALLEQGLALFSELLEQIRSQE